MPLLLPSDALDARRAAAAGRLAPLVESLTVDLERVLATAPEPDARKARLSRAGGRCPRDGALLAFDPFSPRLHRCPRCGAVWQDEAHDRWWVMWHQLWLAERAVHAAELHLLVGAPRLAAFAAGVLDAYATRYLDYPNRDNVLGPSRPFFSTYLESIWLLQLCVALDALEAAEGPRMHALGARVRERVVAPSCALIAGYPEPGSNRQVWNAAALLAASQMLGDEAAAMTALDGPHGVLAQLREGLLPDGSWYEGENYHQFAHRGLWYGLTLADAAGMPVPAPLRARFDEGFAAPFLVAMPDFTLPSRRDSQYAISLRQWRYAESCELGLARRDDPRLAAALGRLYDDVDVPRRDTGRWRSAAESERNEPASALTRADLGWRALLHARPERPAPVTWAPGTVHLPAQGLAVFRRDAGRLWVAVDYGHAGGGHGHPDRLNLLLADGATRWLDDMGTGTYVERALHWYRSTLAHQAPLVDGASQPGGDGRLVAIAEDGDLSGIVAAARPARGVDALRTVVVDGTCVLDRLSWRADREVVVDLPFHVDGDAPLPWEPVSRVGAGGLEDGFDFLEEVERAPIDAESDALRLALRAPDGTPSPGALWIVAPAGAELWRARAPGPPGSGTRRFHVVRHRAPGGEVLSLVDPRGVVRDVVAGDGVVELAFDDGTTSVHRLPAPDDADGVWRVQRRAHGGDPSEHRLALPHVVPQWEAPPTSPTADVRAPIVLPAAGAWTATLGEPHYRRSEASWTEAGGPGAIVRLWADDDTLRVDVEVALGRPPAFVPRGRENPLDNERPEVNGDGVQLHLATPALAAVGALAGWLLVPEVAGGVRVIPTAPAADAIPLRASWTPRADGYHLSVTVPRAPLRLDDRDAAGRTLLLDVLVNEMPEGRERRRGQLVLGGAAGGFVYLQGDRHAAARCVPVVLPPPATR